MTEQTQTPDSAAAQASGEGQKTNWFKEVMASFVVFLVALPLCMGIAIASGVPPAAGLISGIIGGLVVGWIAGSPLQVSGPAAGLVVLVYEIYQQHGIKGLGVAVFVAGLLQVAAGALQLGRWFRATSPAVIEGMLAGIGVLIFASQFHAMIDDKPRASGLENLLSIPEALYKSVFPLDGSVHHLAAAVGLLTIITLLLWNRFRPERLKALPGALLGIIAGSLFASLAGLTIQFVTVPADMAQSITFPTLSSFNLLLDKSFLTSVFALALIASAESLLCASAVDKLHTGPRTNYNRELLAQGIGNTLCGLVGALPMTGVIVRSSANVGAGAKTRYSAILHGAWLLILVLALPWLLELIPRAGLAAILVFTGYKLLNPSNIVKLFKKSRGEFAVFMSTLVMIVAADLLTGVLVGLAAAAIRLLLMFSRIEVRSEERDDRVLEINIAGAATFVSLPKLAAALEKIPKEREIHIHIGELAFIDAACVELLDEWENNYERQGGKVLVEWDRLEQKSSSTLLLSTSRKQKPSTPQLPTAAAE